MGILKKIPLYLINGEKMKEINSTPKKDGFRMPGEFERQKRIWMIWPERPDNWRDGGKPAQETYRDVAVAISKFTPVTMVVSSYQFENCRRMLPANIRVIEMSNNDAWMRDCGPIFVKNDSTGEIRLVDFGFNAWGGLYLHIAIERCFRVTDIVTVEI